MGALKRPRCCTDDAHLLWEPSSLSDTGIYLYKAAMTLKTHTIRQTIPDIWIYYSQQKAVPTYAVS